MAELINKASWSSILTIATIVCGVFYLEDRFKNIVTTAVSPINVELLQLKKHQAELKETQMLLSFKCEAYERYFVKPNDIKLENEKWVNIHTY